MSDQLEFDLQQGIDNPEKAPEIIKSVQASFTELTNASLVALETAKEAKSVAEEYEKQVKLLTTANLDLVEAMKNIHIILGARTDMFKDDSEMQEVMAGLSLFVTGSAAIKLGVVKEGARNG